MKNVYRLVAQEDPLSKLQLSRLRQVEGNWLFRLDRFAGSVVCIVPVLAPVHNHWIVLLLPPIKAVETNLS
jgi:hypothetical protein